MKVVVVGGGAAGTAASLALRRGDAEVVVLDGAAGATDLCSGAWDIATVSDGNGLAPLSLADRIEALAERSEAHPYARIPSPVEAIARAHELFFEAVGGYRPIDLSSRGVRVATDRGAIRCVASVDSHILDLDQAPFGLVAVASFRGYQGADGGFLARCLSESGEAGSLSFVEVPVEFLDRRSDSLMWPHEMAALGDADDAVQRLSMLLARALPGASPHAWLLPPLLGLEKEGARAALEAELDQPVGEVAQAGAGAQGFRLKRRLVAARAALGIEDQAVRATAVESGKVRLEGGRVLEADAIVLASGSALSGGLVSTDDGLEEPLTHTRLPLGEYGGLSAPGQAFLSGLNVDARYRLVDGGVRSGIFVCGSLLAGASHGDGTGLGAAVTTGWLAGESVLAG